MPTPLTSGTSRSREDNTPDPRWCDKLSKQEIQNAALHSEHHIADSLYFHQINICMAEWYEVLIFVCIVVGTSMECLLVPAGGVFFACLAFYGRCLYHNKDIYCYIMAVDLVSYGLLNKKINRGKIMDAYLPPPPVNISYINSNRTKVRVISFVRYISNIVYTFLLPYMLSDILFR